MTRSSFSFSSVLLVTLAPLALLCLSSSSSVEAVKLSGRATGAGPLAKCKVRGRERIWRENWELKKRPIDARERSRAESRSARANALSPSLARRFFFAHLYPPVRGTRTLYLPRQREDRPRELYKGVPGVELKTPR